MLPILVTIGQGLLWFATTVGQLFVWGAGIGLGYWAINKVTRVIDYKLASKHAEKVAKEAQKAPVPGSAPLVQ